MSINLTPGQQIPFYFRYLKENDWCEDAYFPAGKLSLVYKVQLINAWHCTRYSEDMTCYYDISLGFNRDETENPFEQCHYGLKKYNYSLSINSLTEQKRTIETPEIVKNACRHLVKFSLNDLSVYKIKHRFDIVHVLINLVYKF